MAVRKIAHPSIDDRKAKGLEARDRAALSSHTKWRPAADRPDPVALLEEQDATREPDLVPVRHGRMMVSPFTFYRGAAEDHGGGPGGHAGGRTGGPAVRGRAPVELRRVRLARAGTAVRPERLRRDAAGAVRVRREADGGELRRSRPATTGSPRRTRARRRWRRCGPTGRRWPPSRRWATMDIWYAHLDEDELMAGIRTAVAGTAKQEKTARKQEKADKQAKAPKKAEKRAAKQEKADRKRRRRRRRRRSGRRRPSRRRTPATACRRCPSSASWSMASTGSSASRRSSSRRATWPPPTGCPRTRSATVLHEQFRAYRATLQDDRRHLLERFEVVDVARKVGRRRQRRDPGVHRPAPGTRRAGPAVPADQGGDSLGARALRGQEPVPAARRARWCRGSG